MRKLWRKIKDIWYGLFWGLRHTDEVVFSPIGEEMTAGVSIVQEQQSNRVSEDLLAGKETRQVQELRYRTYQVDRESKNFEYFSPFLAMRREEKQDSKFVYYENSDNLELITIQNNFPDVETLVQSIDNFDKTGLKQDFWVKVQRNKGFLTRYRIEEYTTKVVVRRLKEENCAIVDFYVSKYPDDTDFKSKGFVREIEHIKNDGLRSDIIDISGISFITSHAYQVPDMLLYEFSIINFINVEEYDGHYILRYKTNIITDGKDLTDKYYCESMAKKYENKEQKHVEYDFYANMGDVTYQCEECGKIVTYNQANIDEMDYALPENSAEENVDIDNTNNVSEYFDLQITEQTFGKKLCKECLKKHLKTLT